MKLAKQIITLSAVALMATGLAFVLISGIVIGAQASVSSELKALKIQYEEDVRVINQTYDDAVAKLDAAIRAEEAKRVPEDYATADLKTAAIDAAKKAKTDALNGNPLTGVKGLDRTKEDDLRAKEIKYEKDRLTERTKDGGKRTRLMNAFFYDDASVTTDVLTNGAEVTLSGGKKLTPMGSLMVSGIAFTLVGGALIATVVVMNKFEGSKKEKTTAKKTAA